MEIYKNFGRGAGTHCQLLWGVHLCDTIDGFSLFVDRHVFTRILSRGDIFKEFENTENLRECWFQRLPNQQSFIKCQQLNSFRSQKLFYELCRMGTSNLFEMALQMSWESPRTLYRYGKTALVMEYKKASKLLSYARHILHWGNHRLYVYRADGDLRYDIMFRRRDAGCPSKTSQTH